MAAGGGEALGAADGLTGLGGVVEGLLVQVRFSNHVVTVTMWLRGVKAGRRTFRS